MLGCDCFSLSSIVYFVGVLTIASKVVPFLLKKIKGNKPVEILQKNYKKDVVYIYQFPGTPTASSLSPFCIKIEAFCRLYGLKFERCNTNTSRGQNDLLPFIELNGEQHADSQIIIRRLTQFFKIKAYPDDRKAAIGHAVDRLLDNHTFNLMIMAKRGVVGTVLEAAASASGVPSSLIPILKFFVTNYVAEKTGERAAISIGRFKETESNELLRNDIIQLQTILGEKKFLLGEEPTAVDCTALGQLAQSYSAIPAARFYLHDLLESTEFAPLKEYLERVKTRIFGDEFCDNK